jgi:hypothetical protein
MICTALMKHFIGDDYRFVTISGSKELSLKYK